MGEGFKLRLVEGEEDMAADGGLGERGTRTMLVVVVVMLMVMLVVMPMVPKAGSQPAQDSVHWRRIDGCLPRVQCHAPYIAASRQRSEDTTGRVKAAEHHDIPGRAAVCRRER